MTETIFSEGVAAFLNQHFVNLASLRSIQKIRSETEDLEHKLKDQDIELRKRRSASLQLAQDRIANIQPALREIRNECHSVSAECERLRLNEEGSLNAEYLSRALSTLAARGRLLEWTKDYLSLVNTVKNLHGHVQKALTSGSVTEAIVPFRSLADLKARLGSAGKPLPAAIFALVSSRLEASRQDIINKGRSSLAAVLQALKWPQAAHTLGALDGKERLLAEFRALFGHLVTLQFLCNTPEPLSLDDLPALVAMEPLVEPVGLRFKFHFEGEKPTNRIDKPEWYLAHIINMVRDHSHFLTAEAQPVLDDSGFPFYDAKTEFASDITCYAAGKLRQDLPRLLQDPFLHAHALDEVVSFDKQLRQLCPGDSDRLPSLLKIMYGTEESLEAWLNLERNHAVLQLEEALDRSNAWDPAVNVRASALSIPDFPSDGSNLEPTDVPSDDDDSIPTASSYALVLSLAAVTDRYRFIADPLVHRRFFREVQMPLVDQYLHHINDRALYVSRKLGSWEQWRMYCGVLNSLQYLHAVFIEWSQQPLFLEMRAAKAPAAGADSTTKPKPEAGAASGSASDSASDSDLEAGAAPSRSVFSATVREVSMMLRDGLVHIAKVALASAFRERLKPYLAGRIWEHKDSAEFGPPDETSVPVLDAIESVRDGLARARELLSRSLFGQLWPQVAKELSKVLFERLKSGKLRFSRRGAHHSHLDMQAVYELFRPYSSRPHNLFKQFREALTLLQLDDKDLHELRKLVNADSSEAPIVLKRHQVFNLSLDDARFVCGLRVDQHAAQHTPSSKLKSSFKTLVAPAGFS